MKRCIVVMNDGRYINTEADRMEIVDNMLYVYSGDSLVALVEVTALISAHLSKKGESCEQ